MKMSDKDLDKLFSSQLADMEIEPSAAVWNNIKRGVAGEEVDNESKKSIIPTLQIAAGIIVFVTVALLLRPHTEKVALRGSYTAAIISNGVRPSIITPQQDAVQDMQVQDAVPTTAVSARRESDNAYRKPATTIASVDTTQIPVDINTNDNTSQPQRTVIAAVPVPTPKSTVAIVSTDEQHAKPKTLALNNAPALKENTIAKKKKIRSLGDLFNVVIAKVDKRPNKIIQFENNDEEEGDFGVAGVNLGPIQIKKNN